VTGSYDDGTVEGDETVEIYLQTDMGGQYTLGSPSSDTLTIVDDDQAPEVWIASVVDAEEGVSDGYFRLERDVTAGALTVYYTFDSMMSTAWQGTDFAELPGTFGMDEGSVTFPSGQSWVNI